MILLIIGHMVKEQKQTPILYEDIVFNSYNMGV